MPFAIIAVAGLLLCLGLSLSAPSFAPGEQALASSLFTHLVRVSRAPDRTIHLRLNQGPPSTMSPEIEQAGRSAQLMLTLSR